MLIGQGPSPTDNTTGLPYSGPAGSFLEKALQQAGLRIEDVWITNLHKCLATRINSKTLEEQMRPPKVDELKACKMWLDEELYWIKPKVLIAIGAPAAKALLGKSFNFSEQRGTWKSGPMGIPTIAIVQPTYLKRQSEWDRPAAVQGWRDLVADLRSVVEQLGQTETSERTENEQFQTPRLGIFHLRIVDQIG